MTHTCLRYLLCGKLLTICLRWYAACLSALIAFRPHAVNAICHQRSAYSNQSSPDALGNSDDDEKRDEPVCSNEDESTVKEEGRSGGSDVALGQQSTAGR